MNRSFLARPVVMLLRLSMQVILAIFVFQKKNRHITFGSVYAILRFGGMAQSPQLLMVAIVLSCAIINLFTQIMFPPTSMEEDHHHYGPRKMFKFDRDEATSDVDQQMSELIHSGSEPRGESQPYSRTASIKA